jgi:gliding motility-associated-like protein
VHKKIIFLIFYLINPTDYSLYGDDINYETPSKDRWIIETSLEKKTELIESKFGSNFNKLAPSISGCPSNIETQLTDACTVPVSWGEPTATDPSGIKSISRTHNPGDNFSVGTTTVIYTFTNNNNEESICSFDVTVKYRFFDLPNDQIINISDGCNTEVFWGEPSNCGISVTSNISSGVSFPIGTTTVTYSAQRPASFPDDIASFTVTVNDNVDPILTNCPNDITLSADENCEAVLSTWNPPTATDNCTSSLVPVADYPLDYKFPIGAATTVTYTATDEAGNTATCSFDVTVVDNSPPELLNIPAEVRVSANENCEAVASWNEITATDNCSSNITVNSNFNSGDFFPLGETSVEYTAGDEAGNVNTASFSVIVEDHTSPITSNCPENSTVFANSNCAAVVNWTPPTFTDGCDNSLQINSTHNPGDTFSIGNTEVTYTATDDAGNQSVCNFIISVEDNSVPQITSQPADIVVSTKADACEAMVSWEEIVAVDNCSNLVDVATNFNSGDVFPLGETVVEITATDESNNESASSFKITVEDNTAPQVISCPSDISISASNNCESLAAWNLPEFLDNCDNDLAISATHDQNFQFPLGTTVVTYRATDNAGNESSCSFSVTIEDDVAPLFTSCTEDIFLEADNDCQSVAEWTIPEAIDNCTSELTLESTYNSGDVFPVGVTEVIYTVTDETGNSSFCKFNIEVLDTDGIEITGCPESISVKADNSNGTAIVDWEEPNSTATCSTITAQSSHRPGNSFDLGTTTVTYTFTNESGQIESCNFDVTVEALVLEVEINELVTPNGDGNNDLWLIEGIEQFPDNQVIIVDRWGAEIYSVRGYNNQEVAWNGENKSGNLVPRGTYYYFISIRNEQDALERKGFLELVR